MSNTTLNPTPDLHLNSTTIGAAPGFVPWYQFHACAVAPYAFVFYYWVKVVSLAVGAPCNLLVMWQITRKKSDVSTSDIFIFNLAILDAYFCLMTPIDMANRLLLGDGRIWRYMKFCYGVKDLAPLFLVCICMDRYMAVVHPVIFTRIRDNKIRIGISLVVWGLLMAYGFSKSLQGVLSVPNIFSGVILFAFAVMVFCNTSVIWTLRRSVVGKDTMHPVKKKAFKMVLTILAIVVVNYLPPVALMPFYEYYTFVTFRCKIAVTVFAIMDLSCSMEPLLYLTKMEKIEGCCCSKGTAEKQDDVKV